MAVTGVPGGGYSMTANTDVLNQATVGNVHLNAPYRTRVKGISAIVTAAPTTIAVIKSGGGSGAAIYSGIPASNGNMVNFAEPIEVDDLALTTVSDNTTAIVIHIA